MYSTGSRNVRGSNIRIIKYTMKFSGSPKLKVPPYKQQLVLSKYMEFRRDIIRDPCVHIDHLVYVEIIKDGRNI